jgi:hypothetical protein
VVIAGGNEYDASLGVTMKQCLVILRLMWDLDAVECSPNESDKPKLSVDLTFCFCFKPGKCQYATVKSKYSGTHEICVGHCDSASSYAQQDLRS